MSTAEQHLPALTGNSPEQIAWAKRIRTRQLNTIELYYGFERHRQQLINEGASDEQKAGYEDGIARDLAKVARLCEQTSASWWIDHCENSVNSLLRAASSQNRP